MLYAQLIEVSVFQKTMPLPSVVTVLADSHTATLDWTTFPEHPFNKLEFAFHLFNLRCSEPVYAWQIPSHHLHWLSYAQPYLSQCLISPGDFLCLGKVRSFCFAIVETERLRTRHLQQPVPVKYYFCTRI